jgi:hypothetical protein
MSVKEIKAIARRWFEELSKGEAAAMCLLIVRGLPFLLRL